MNDDNNEHTNGDRLDRIHSDLVHIKWILGGILVLPWLGMVGPGRL